MDKQDYPFNRRLSLIKCDLSEHKNKTHNWRKAYQHQCKCAHFLRNRKPKIFSGAIRLKFFSGGLIEQQGLFTYTLTPEYKMDGALQCLGLGFWTELGAHTNLGIYALFIVVPSLCSTKF